MSQLLSVLCTELTRLCTRMADLWSWKRLCHKCESIYARYGGKHDEIPTESLDALVAFDEMKVEKGVMRFVVYIFFLKDKKIHFKNIFE